MDIFIISMAAFFTAILTFFSGFGLGTILTPVFAIFFPIEVAIALTGVVHLSNNLFKIALVGKKSDLAVLLKFGIPAIIASFAGAWLLIQISEFPTIAQYELSGKTFSITPIKLIIATILIIFASIEIIPKFQKIEFSKDKLIIGGVISGFFGGLSGIQGAVRSAFLIKSGLSKEAYIATGVVIASMVDISRLSVYASRFNSSGLGENLPLVVSATIAAIAGAYIGKKFLTKVTLKTIQTLVAIMLILISMALGVGLI